jgi:hypothetical protein
MTEEPKAKPDCYQCTHRRNLPGDEHSACVNREAKVMGNAHGIRHGWFFWPFNYDPVWLQECTGFVKRAAKPIETGRPF